MDCVGAAPCLDWQLLNLVSLSLQTNVALKSLSLAWNGLRWSGAVAFARHVFAVNAVLTKIDISKNDIDGRAATHIAKVAELRDWLLSWVIRLLVHLPVFWLGRWFVMLESKTRVQNAAKVALRNVCEMCVKCV